jgi:hypothetical protein
MAGRKCKLAKIDENSFIRLLGPHRAVFDEQIRTYGVAFA